MPKADSSLTQEAQRLSPVVARFLGVEPQPVRAGWAEEGFLGVGASGANVVLRRFGKETGRLITLKQGMTPAMQEQALVHELVHWYLHGRDWPIFLEEGLCDAISGELTEFGAVLCEAREAVLANTTFSRSWASGMDRKQVIGLSREEKDAYYALAYGYVLESGLFALARQGLHHAEGMLDRFWPPDAREPERPRALPAGVGRLRIQRDGEAIEVLIEVPAGSELRVPVPPP